MGRVTNSFRQRFREEIKNFEQFQDSLIEPARRDAVDYLKRAVSDDLGILSYSYILTALDGILLCEEINNRKIITVLTDYSKKLENKIDELEHKIDAYELADSI